jgi:hypothetical protein
MMTTLARSSAITYLAALALVTAGCSTLDAQDYCRYSEERSFRDVDPGSLALVIGVKPDRARQTPFVVFRNRAEDSPQAFLRLSANAAPHPLPVDLDESRCAGVDWRTYDLAVDPAEWRGFWQQGGASRFEIAIAFLEDHSPLPVSEFGAAIVDTDAASHLVSCGCYWK